MELATTTPNAHLQHAQSALAQSGAMTNVNAGAVAIEQERAIAEARGKLFLAKQFPRDLNRAFAELVQACRVKAFASAAFYKRPQGGGAVTGPSIRLAEEIARCYGNFDYGHRELSRVEATTDSFGRSEVEVYAWDMEQNNFSRRQITVLHVLDTREGPRRLRDQTEVDNKIANVASKQMRGRILALVPKWMVEAAVEECKKTIAGGNEQSVAERVRNMVAAFGKYGVTTGHLESYLGHSLDSTTIDELVDLIGIHNALREGKKPSEYFTASGAVEGATDERGAKIKSLATQGSPATDAAPAPAPTAPKKGGEKKDDVPKQPAKAPADSMPKTEAENTDGVDLF